MSPLILWLASLLTRAERTDHAECRPGWYVNGVRPSGQTECIKAPSGNGSNECIPGGACTFIDNADRYPIAVTCTGGTSPRVITERSVGCR